MKSFKQVLLLTGCLCLIGICPASIVRAQAGPAQELRWKLKPGSRFEASLDQTTELSSQVEKRQRTVDNQLSIKLEWLVESSNETEAIIVQKITGLRVLTTSPTTGKKIDIDTNIVDEKGKSSLEKELLTQIRPLIGTEFRVTMTTLGEVQNVVVSEQSLEVLRNVPGSMQLRTLFSQQGLKDLYGQSSIKLPADPVSNGFDWKVEEQQKTPLGLLDRIHQYKIADISPVGQVDIQLVTTVSGLNPDEQTQSRLVSFTGAGAMKFDAANGHPVSSQFTNMMQTEKPYREKTVSTKVTTTIKMSLNSLPADKE